MKFSVLLSVYKNEKPEYLQIALKSIVNQTMQPNEIVIVEDGLLTAELDEVIQNFKNSYQNLVKIVPFKENRGLGLALRDGVLACSYEYIARMDTDDICKPDRFEKQITFLEKHFEIALLGTAIEEFSDDEKKPNSILIMPKTHKEIVRFAKIRNPFKHPTVIFKKSAILKSGNYRHFLWFEDYDLFVRVIYNGFMTANLEEILISVRADKNQFDRRGGWKYWKQDLLFQRFLLKINFISLPYFIFNTLSRLIVRMIPSNLRKAIYYIFLRKSV